MSESGGKKAALLIDWDNLNNALRGRYLFDEKKIAKGLIGLVERFAGPQELYAAVFAPGLPAGVTDALIAGGLTPVATLGGKNAADLRIAIEACDKFNDGYRYFVVVTGDADFVPLLRRLKQDGGDAHIWVSHPEQRLGGPLRDLAVDGQVKYVSDPEMLDLRKAPPAVAGNAEALLLLCHRMYGEYGKSLKNNWRAGVERLSEYGVFEHPEIVAGLDKAQERRSDLHWLNSKKQTRWTDPTTSKFLAMCDGILAHVHRFERRDDSDQDIGDLVRSQSDGTVGDDESVKRSVASLASAGYLVDTGDGMRFSLASYTARLGIGDALRRIVFTVLAQARQFGWAVVGNWKIEQRWERTYLPGERDWTPDKKKGAADEAKEMLNRARIEGLVEWAELKEGDKTFRGWKVNEEHPFVVSVLRESSTVMKSVVQFHQEHGRGATAGELAEALNDVSQSRVQFWLTVLAPERCARLIRGSASPQGDRKMYRWLVDGQI